MIWIALPLLALGLTMYTRGLIYTLRPGGRMAEKRKKRNLRVGFTTDMAVFGRKVRRVGFLLALAGAALLAWERAGDEPAPAGEPSAPAAAAP